MLYDQLVNLVEAHITIFNRNMGGGEVSKLSRHLTSGSFDPAQFHSNLLLFAAMSSKNILVIGTGAIGGFYASRLSTVPGVRVSAICRSNYDVIKKNGLRVTSPIFGDTIFRPTYTFASADEARATKRREGLPWDYLIVTTKVLGDPSALAEGLVDGDSTVVVFQNGLGVEEPYGKRFPKSPIISAVTRYVGYIFD